MNLPDRSDNVCGSPVMEVDLVDEEGNEETVCGCHRCSRARKMAYLEQYGGDRRDKE